MCAGEMMFSKPSSGPCCRRGRRTTGPDGAARAPRVEDLVAFAEETLPTYLVERARVREDERVRDAETIRIGAEEGVPTAVVVTNKKTTSAALKSIAHALEGRFRFLEVARTRKIDTLVLMAPYSVLDVKTGRSRNPQDDFHAFLPKT